MKFLAGFIVLCITITTIVYIKENPKTTQQTTDSALTNHYIDVSGYHSETFSSDKIIWELQISLMGKEKEELLLKKNERVKELSSLVASLGIDTDSLIFENYTLKKDWTWEQGKRIFTAYHLNQNIVVPIKTEEKSDIFSENLVQIGDIEIQNVKYEISNKEEKVNQIASIAFEKAKSKANVLAKSAGKKLKTVITISENPIQDESFSFAKMNLTGAASGMRGTSGPTKTTLASQVYVRFLLE